MPDDDGKRQVGRPVERIDVLDFLEERLQKDKVFPTVKPHIDATRKEFSGGRCYVHKHRTTD